MEVPVSKLDSRIRIKLKAYDHRLLDQSVAEIIKSTRNTGAKVVGPICVARRQIRVHDPALPACGQEVADQFQTPVHKRLIDIVNPTQQTTTVLPRSLSLPAGAHVEIKANSRG